MFRIRRALAVFIEQVSLSLKEKHFFILFFMPGRDFTSLFHMKDFSEVDCFMTNQEPV